MPFSGFRTEALRFLDELGRNNERAWFQAHRSDYEDFLLEPARDFVEAIGAGVSTSSRPSTPIRASASRS